MTKKRVLKTKSFARWMRKNEIQNQDLSNAICEMELGLVDADLGRNIFKKRIRCSGSGKRSGARIIIATQFMRCWFFIYGFAKNEKVNINKTELLYLQETAKRLLNLTDRDIDNAIDANELKEIKIDEK